MSIRFTPKSTPAGVIGKIIEFVKTGETQLKTVDVNNVVTQYSPAHGWNEISDTWTYNAADKINVPSDATTYLQKGVKLRFKQGGAYKYYNGITIAATLVTVLVNDDFTVANAAITDIAYSYAENPLGWPKTFNYTPTVSPTGGGAFGAAPTVNYADYDMGTGLVVISITINAVGTAAGTVQFSIPWTANVGFGSGRENAATGNMLQAQVNGANISILTYNNTATITNGWTLIIGCVTDW